MARPLSEEPSDRGAPGSAGGSERRDFLLYDGECPVCSRYVAWTSLRQHHPGIELLNARDEPDLVALLREEGIDINDTFVLETGGERFIGAAAMARISSLMPDDTLFSRVVRGATSREGVMRPVYPLLVRGRKLLLALIGRSQIR
ncbi:MAG: DCC1-like thiol-disulfide oxidoreductase family protein [Pseudomonadota bacterium]